jgi:hypothetical protein
MGFDVLSQLTVAVGPALALAELAALGALATPGPWKPPQWGSGPALTSITVPATSGPGTTNAGTPILGNPLPSAPAYQGAPQQVYVFDAVLKLEHERELRRTEHPIQSSASAPVLSITDHAFRLPARVTLEIGMSDAMDSYSDWTSAATKSVSAFATLSALQDARTLVILTTRLATYKNMLIESIRPTDDVKTRWGLRATVTLGEVFLADATAVSANLITSPDDMQQPLSAQPQTTDSTQLGSVQGSTPSDVIESQHKMYSGLPLTQTLRAASQSVPGAGYFSSVNVNKVVASF